MFLKEEMNHQVRSKIYILNRTMDRITSLLLTEIDGLSSSISSNNFFIFASTSNLNLIDGSIKRPGRLSEHIFINNPDENGRKDLLKFWLSPLPLDEGLKGELDEIISKMSQKCMFCSIAIMKNIITETGLSEIRKGVEYYDTETLLQVNKI